MIGSRVVTGQDGAIGDDGRILTSRNSTTGESIYGVAGFAAGDLDLTIATPGNIQTAIINVSGELKKGVNLTPFNLDIAGGDPLFDGEDADDIIFGGLGSDFLHGGAGDDAISGAEALQEYYDNPVNNGNYLRWGEERAGEFAAYDEYDPRSRVMVDANGVFDWSGNGTEFVLNFSANEGELVDVDTYSDGDDVLFGDLGNDWLVGGTGRDHAYGGWGDDLMNVDDDHDTNGGANDVPDTHVSYEDRAYGGAGRDILIGNTGGDRLIDWAGEFNSYLVPFAPFGGFTISRNPQPQLMEFLYDLSEAHGADATRASDTGSDASRNGEPEGELGLVKQSDFAWRDQTGAPDDPQPGNIPGGKRDVLQSAGFNTNTGGNSGGSNGNNNSAQTEGFSADSGNWEVDSGRLEVSPESLGDDAVAVYHVSDTLPGYFEIQATINAGKPTGGLKSNAYIIFDYQSPSDFKFAGVNISNDKLEIGYRDASGWHVMDFDNAKLKPNKDYNLLLALNGVTATLVVDNSEVFSMEFAPRVDSDGYAYGLNAGMVGIGAYNSVARIDNVAVQILPPDITFETTEDFSDGTADHYVEQTGTWSIANGDYTADSSSDFAIATSDLVVAGESVIELEAVFDTDGMAGFVYDYYSDTDYKFVALSATTNELIFGHYTERGGLVIDDANAVTVGTGVDVTLKVTIAGRTISAYVNGQIVGGHIYNGILPDGASGLISQGTTNFDEATFRTNDPDHQQTLNLMATEGVLDVNPNTLTQEELELVAQAAIAQWRDSGLLTAEQLARLDEVTFEIQNLDGQALGLTDGTNVIIDTDAAGQGWFIDQTPSENEEYTGVGTTLDAVAGTGADGDIDLFTVISP